MNLASEQLAAISRLFSSSVIREMARKGRSPLFARLANQSLLVDSRSELQHVYSFFELRSRCLKRRAIDTSTSTKPPSRTRFSSEDTPCRRHRC